MIDYQAVIDDLETKRKAMNARFDAAVAAIRQVLALEGAQPVLPGIIRDGVTPYGSGPLPYKDLSMVEAAKEYLSSVPGPVPNVELAKALEAGGFTHRSKNFPNTLNSVLRRRAMTIGDVRKDTRGWTLNTPKRAIRLRGDDETVPPSN